MAAFDNLRNWFRPSFETEQERHARELQEESNQVWDDILAENPDVQTLMGIDPAMLSPAGLGMPPPPVTGKGPRTQAQGRALAEWRAEYERRKQEALSDPFFGLQQLGDPEMGQAAADQGSIDAQRLALKQMQGIYDAGGYTDAERAQLQQSQFDAANAERSQRLAVQQQMAARGMGGGGMEMMGALAAQQGGANRANQWANQIAVAGQQRALQALQHSGDWASNMRNQSFGEDSARRTARDAWNAANVSMQNDWTRQRGQMAQQHYQNQLAAAAGATDQYNSQAANLQNQAAADTNAAGNIISAGITAAATAFGGPAAGAATSTGLSAKKSRNGGYVR